MGEHNSMGFNMAEYSEFMAIRAIYETYIDAILNLRPVPFDQVMGDAIRKWTFIDQWASRQKSRAASYLSKRFEKDRILELATLDEPMCVDGLVSSLGENRCSVCPLWHINGHPCEEQESVKSMILLPLYTGVGFFVPYRLTTVLWKIKRKQPIYRADIDPIFR